MKVKLGTADVRDIVKSDDHDISERLRYLVESKQDVSIKISCKYGDTVEVEINEAKPETVEVVEVVKKGPGRPKGK